ncbi:MAG: class I SAM-dependent methyltransferase [Nanoarchaeota archaeon]
MKIKNPNIKLNEILTSNKASADFIRENKIKSYAEIGCNYGNTAFLVAQALPIGGEMFLFDYPEYITIAKEKLRKIAREKKLKIRFYSNSRRRKDSYCWTLLELVKRKKKIFDYVYLDGSHDFTIDGLSFFLIDRLLKVGGYIDFDDYNWTFSKSAVNDPKINPKILEKYTYYQLTTSHVKLIIDFLVRPMKRYKEIKINRIFQKLCDEPQN